MVTNQLVVREIALDVDDELLVYLLGNIHVNERGCWIRSSDINNYTTIRYKGKVKPAHVVSYEIFKGYPVMRQGCHHCDTPACINPDHIFDGTQSQNMQDCRRKNRLVGITIAPSKHKYPVPEPKPQVHYRRKYTASELAEARASMNIRERLDKLTGFNHVIE